MAIVMPFVQVGTYPDKEFRYLRTVIVTAAVYWGFDQELRDTPSLNLPAPGRRHTLYVDFRVCRVLCFNKQSQPPILCDRFMLSAQALHTTPGIPSPEVTVSICRVPSPEFSQAPEYSSRPPVSVCGTVSVHLKLSGFSWKPLPITSREPRSCITPLILEPGFA